jgi:hypothetical protein
MLLLNFLPTISGGSTMYSFCAQVWDNKYLITFIFVAIYQSWKQWVSYHRLAKFKGPFWASVTNLWMARNMVSGEIHKKVSSTMEEYGGHRSNNLTQQTNFSIGELVRVGPNMLFTTNPDLIHQSK